MSRIVSVWLPRWPIRRFLAAQQKNPGAAPVDPDRPFVLVVAASGGPRIAALNEAAEAAGLALGESLADARAKAGPLQTRPLDAAADDAALRRLALWATRYTPTASAWDLADGADGFFLDIEGAAHLFGGEERLLADLTARLQQNFGLSAKLAVADTPGTAWALAHFHDSAAVVLPSGEEAQALKPFPVEALRLSAETCRTLRRLGLKTIGALLDKPRAPFAARFPAELLRRIDQALGHSEEPLIPIVAPPVYHSLRYLLEPIFTQEAIVGLTRRLLHTLIRVLERDDVGARTLRLSLYRVDGAAETIDVGLTLPTRQAAHMLRLIDLKLEALAAAENAGFGFEAIGLAVTCAEPMVARQNDLAACLSSRAGGNAAGFGDNGQAERCAALIDTLTQRLGSQSVRVFAPVASHIPEQAEMLQPIAAGAIQLPSSSAKEKAGNGSAAWSTLEQKPQPLLILPRAEATDVVALIPDGPPRRFYWRGVTYEVANAEGPERIAGEWWHLDERQPALTRDYYLVEDAGGHRFWLFREGLYERETDAARWFVHGLFA